MSNALLTVAPHQSSVIADTQRSELSRSGVLNRECTSIQFVIDSIQDTFAAYAEVLGKDWEQLSVCARRLASGLSWIEASATPIELGKFKLVNFAVGCSGHAAQKAEKIIADGVQLDLTDPGQMLRGKLSSCGLLVEKCSLHLLHVVKAAANAPEEMQKHLHALNQTRGDATAALNEIVDWFEGLRPPSRELTKKSA